MTKEHGIILHDLLVDFDDQYGLQITHENDIPFLFYLTGVVRHLFPKDIAL